MVNNYFVLYKYGYIVVTVCHINAYYIESKP
jgi:hypothetical protein